MEHGYTGHNVLSMSVHLHTVLSLVIVLLSLKLLHPCSLYVQLGWQLNAISQSYASLVSYKLCLNKYGNPVTSLNQAIVLTFCL